MLRNYSGPWALVSTSKKSCLVLRRRHSSPSSRLKELIESSLFKAKLDHISLTSPRKRLS